ncbi:MAG: MarR family transcriptional regulator [bacterium]
MSIKCDSTDLFHEQLCGLFRKLALLDREEKNKSGLTLPQCHVVETLAQSGPVTVHELGNLIGVAPSTMTRVLDLLARDGFIQRNVDAADRRKVRVILTEKGHAAARNLNEYSTMYCRHVSALIPKHKLSGIVQGLKLLNQALAEASKKIV